MTNGQDPAARRKVPRNKSDDYTIDAAAARRDFAREVTGTDLTHVGKYSFDPGVLPGNIENFMGVAQVPMGLAGPLTIHGEHAVGEFYIPMATTEGTLVASYNRGMRLLSECGGVKTTVVNRAGVNFRVNSGERRPYARRARTESTKVFISVSAPTATWALAMSAGLRIRTVRTPSVSWPARRIRRRTAAGRKRRRPKARAIVGSSVAVTSTAPIRWAK